MHNTHICWGVALIFYVGAVGCESPTSTNESTSEASGTAAAPAEPGSGSDVTTGPATYPRIHTVVACGDAVPAGRIVEIEEGAFVIPSDYLEHIVDPAYAEHCGLVEAVGEITIEEYDTQSGARVEGPLTLHGAVTVPPGSLFDALGWRPDTALLRIGTVFAVSADVLRQQVPGWLSSRWQEVVIISPERQVEHQWIISGPAMGAPDVPRSTPPDRNEEEVEGSRVDDPDDAEFGTVGDDPCGSESRRANVRRVSQSEWELSVPWVDAFVGACENPGRFAPSYQAGAPNGWRLLGARSFSGSSAMGLRNGDILVLVQGDPPEGAPSIAGLFETLRSDGELRIDVVRRGREQALTVRAVDP